MPRLLAVCRVARLLPDPGTVGVTAIDKRPVEGPVVVRELGLYADVQADRAHHGGEDKALYAYSSEDAQWWEQQLGRELPPGRFGENLRSEGLEVSGAVIGERWRIGASVEVEVTMPRTPCATFQRVLDEPQWVRRFTEAGRVGAYVRVLRRGSLEAGDAIEVLSRPEHGVPVDRWFRERRPEDAQALLEAAEQGALRLAPALLVSIERALA
ncbi:MULTISPECIES: MOSC domain-containing protein [unclassified Rathayibacter]|uniref:MOSC domain-containing protein n=1 Tax=unclassified Rathayibacter TaxID=2609250 RepID=UPI00188D87C2|nr:MULTISPECIES: MOSC domain-containing protein [unclassified Rathayibacter]MBF4462840.1 MOSC domain-containing protein [Rathayibacter sp. VKM Ac-2879]MBF4504254.1 MOSC domain-containing protein [Rathayibacter sp. VKM Ac-2878]